MNSLAATKLIIYTVSQKKTSHFNFRHNFAICWDIFTIFEAPCSGLISRSYSLLHTRHRCEAFTWCDVTRDVIQTVVRCAYTDAEFHTHLTYGLWTHRTCWIFFLQYRIMQEKVYQTHIANIDDLKHRLVQVWAELDHRHRCSYRTVATLSQSVWLVCERSRGYFEQHLHRIYM